MGLDRRAHASVDAGRSGSRSRRERQALHARVLAVARAARTDRTRLHECARCGGYVCVGYRGVWYPGMERLAVGDRRNRLARTSDERIVQRLPRAYLRPHRLVPHRIRCTRYRDPDLGRRFRRDRIDEPDRRGTRPNTERHRSGIYAVAAGRALDGSLGWIYYVLLALPSTIGLFLRRADSLRTDQTGRALERARLVAAVAGGGLLLLPTAALLVPEPSTLHTLTVGSAHFWAVWCLWCAVVCDGLLARGPSSGPRLGKRQEA